MRIKEKIDNIGKMEINKILLNMMSNGWSKQVFVQGFDSEKSVNMFECMVISRTIYEGVV